MLNYNPPHKSGSQCQKPVAPTLSPQPPNVASLGRYSEYPVDTYTSVPIQPSYHASSIKVGDVPSWVGLGWSLSAGGSVSNTIVGLPDDRHADGYWGFGIPDNPNQAGSDQTTCEQRRFAVQRILDGRKNNGADIFQYNFPITSGRFILKRNNANSFTAVTIYANRDVIKVRRQSDQNGFKLWINQFKITDETVLLTPAKYEKLPPLTMAINGHHRPQPMKCGLSTRPTTHTIHT